METLSERGGRYNAVAIALHWIIAAMIIANFLLVWTAEDAPKAEEQRLVGLHMATGISILLFSVLRIIWRITHPAPALDPGLKSWEARLAKLTHTAFYILIVAIPVTGWIMTSAFSGGYGVNVYGLFEFPGLPLAKSEQTAGVLHEIHEIFAFLMLLLFVLHVGAALKHHFVDKGDTLARMIPFLRRND